MDVLLVLPDFVEEGDGSVSINSPIGRALLGRVGGDRVSIDLPEGSQEARFTLSRRSTRARQPSPQRAPEPSAASGPR